MFPSFNSPRIHEYSQYVRVINVLYDYIQHKHSESLFFLYKYYVRVSSK